MQGENKNIFQEDIMSREDKIEYIHEKLRDADDYTIDEIFWALELDGWEEVIRNVSNRKEGGVDTKIYFWSPAHIRQHFASQSAITKI